MTRVKRWVIKGCKIESMPKVIEKVTWLICNVEHTMFAKQLQVNCEFFKTSMLLSIHKYEIYIEIEKLE